MLWGDETKAKLDAAQISRRQSYFMIALTGFFVRPRGLFLFVAQIRARPVHFGFNLLARVHATHHTTRERGKRVPYFRASQTLTTASEHRANIWEHNAYGRQGDNLPFLLRHRLILHLDALRPTLCLPFVWCGGRPDAVVKCALAQPRAEFFNCQRESLILGEAFASPNHVGRRLAEPAHGVIFVVRDRPRRLG